MSDSLRNLAALSLIVGLAAGGALAEDTQADKPSGCYVTLYDGDGFSDKSVTIPGPVKLDSLASLPEANGKSWNGEADSFKLGPSASMQAFAGEHFKGKSRTYTPGTEEANTTFEFDSVWIVCRAKKSN